MIGVPKSLLWSQAEDRASIAVTHLEVDDDPPVDGDNREAGDGHHPQ